MRNIGSVCISYGGGGGMLEIDNGNRGHYSIINSQSLIGARNAATHAESGNWFNIPNGVQEPFEFACNRNI